MTAIPESWRNPTGVRVLRLGTGVARQRASPARIRRVRLAQQHARLRVFCKIGVLFEYPPVRSQRLSIRSGCFVIRAEPNVNGWCSMWKSEDVLERYEPPMRKEITAALFASNATAANLRALVVTEEVLVRALVRLHLGSAGFDVTELADGARAVAIGRTARFEVIVLDVRLPTVDGSAVCRALRAHGPNVDTPILMLIAADRESDTVKTP